MSKSVICDWRPCATLQTAIGHFLSPTWKPGEDVKFDIVDRTLGGKTRPVFLTYCPFCGTRIRNNKDILDWIENLDRG